MPLKTPTKPMGTRIRVYASLGGAQVVNENERRVRLTIISVGPGNNAQKVFYTQKAIDSAPPIFEGCALGIDHPDEIEKRIRSEGSIKDLAGIIKNVFVDGEELKGDAVVYPGPDYAAIWTQIKFAIDYAKENPGKNHIGVSVNAETGPATPIKYEGETWYSVDKFTEAHRVDIVTKPARGGKFEKVISESAREGCGIPGFIAQSIRGSKGESETGGQAPKIFKNLSDHVRELEKQKAQGAADTRRMIDSLGSSLNLNGATEGKSMKGDPKALATEALKHAGEAFRSAAESEADPAKKAEYLQKADDMQEMSEGELTISHKPTPPAGDGSAPPAAPPAGAPPAGGLSEAETARKASEDESRRKAAEDEARRKAAESEGGRKAAESDRKYAALLIDTLLEKSGLPDGKKAFLRLSLESERDETRIKNLVATYTKMHVEDSNRGFNGYGPRFEISNGSQPNPGKVDLRGHLKSHGVRLASV